MEEVIRIFFLLMVAHAVADFALQSDTMSKGKNRNKKPDYIPAGQKYCACWPYWLGAHSLIAGGAVYAVTGLLSLGIFETVAHWIIDFLRCENLTTPHRDQFDHIVLRVCYAGIWYLGVIKGVL